MDPSVICLVETHLDEAERVQLERINSVFRYDKSSDSGGIIVAIKDKLKNIAIQLEETKDIGETLWIKIDNGKAVGDGPAGQAMAGPELAISHSN